ncbi:MAG: hypothetical protein H7843_04610 [Nitrospirota bacterium]
MKSLLYSYERAADVIFSPDEKWLVINDAYGSNGADAILFKKVKSLKYKAITTLSDLAWDLLRKTNKRHKIPSYFGHNYTFAVFWSADSKAILLETFGHDDDTPKALAPWYCIYDLKTKKMSLDLNTFNRGTYYPDRTKARYLYKY